MQHKSVWSWWLPKKQCSTHQFGHGGFPNDRIIIREREVPFIISGCELEHICMFFLNLMAGVFFLSIKKKRIDPVL
jgi:hypothetical protein